MIDKWKSSESSIEQMSEEIQQKLEGLVEQIATKKTINKHSRPWIDKELSTKLNELRESRRKFFRHRSISNKQSFEQCSKIANATSGKEKWKIINKMTNSAGQMSIQPIRIKDQNGRRICV